MFYEWTDSTGTGYGNYMNTQLDGATHPLKLATLRTLAQRWRLTYMSVTMYQDGPDLANQGTIVACQPAVQASRLNWSGLNAAGNGTIAAYPMECYRVGDRPLFDNMQSMPNAYFGRSKEGVYMPLRLTKTCQQWRSMENAVHVMQSDLGDPQETTGTYQMPAAAVPGVYPHSNINCAYHNPGVGFGGEATSAMCNDVWGMIAFKNVAVTTSFTFFVRAGYEIQCQPGTPYSTHLKLSPPHDPLALDTYFRISRELKDAYPADFNDLGKIWDVISSAAKTIAPALGFIPGIGPAIQTGVGLATSAGDAIRAAFKRIEPAGASGRRGQETASFADREMAKEAIKAVRSAPVARRARKTPRKKTLVKLRGSK